MSHRQAGTGWGSWRLSMAVPWSGRGGMAGAGPVVLGGIVRVVGGLRRQGVGRSLRERDELLGEEADGIGALARGHVEGGVDAAGSTEEEWSAHVERSGA